MSKLLQKIFGILGIFGLGVVGAMFWQIILLPYLGSVSIFQDIPFFQDYAQRQIVLNPVQKIYIQENKALVKAIERAEKAVVGVKSQTNTGLILQGSGLILTSDGLMVTLADLLPRGANYSFWVNNEKVGYEILKRDFANNLALVKLEKTDLSIVGFAETETFKKGQPVFLIGTAFLGEKEVKMVNQGLVRYLDSNFIRTNISDSLKGSILFDFETNVLGINNIGLDGEVITIPVSKIQEFAEF